MRTLKASAKNQRKYYYQNRAGRLAYAAKYRSENRDKYLASLKKSRLKNGKWHIEYRDKRRLAVIKYYSGGKMCCACCGEKTIQFLAIDHIDKRYGSGAAHRKKIGSNLAWWLVTNNFPDGFQILCHNCNFAKSVYTECPHKTYAK